MTEHDSLWGGIVAAPDDDLPRLVYADWLDEHGMETEAAYIRLVTRRPELLGGPGLGIAPDSEASEILKAGGHSWMANATGRLVALTGQQWERWGVAHRLRMHFHRQAYEAPFVINELAEGSPFRVVELATDMYWTAVFPDHAEGHYEMLRKMLPYWCKFLPIRTVTLTDKVPENTTLYGLPRYYWLNERHVGTGDVDRDTTVAAVIYPLLDGGTVDTMRERYYPSAGAARSALGRALLTYARRLAGVGQAAAAPAPAPGSGSP